MTSILNKRDFMKFPFEITAQGAANSDRRRHVREQIEQVLFTLPRERWYRPDFGVGVRSLVFEPNNAGLTEVTRKRLLASLVDALAGEVEPKSLEVTVSNDSDKLKITISYVLAALTQQENMTFMLEDNV